jgi:hypothetical protein
VRWDEVRHPFQSLYSPIPPVPITDHLYSYRGFSLAYAELYVVIAIVFRRFEMELWETTRDHVDMVRDGFIPIPKRPATEMKILVK